MTKTLTRFLIESTNVQTFLKEASNSLLHFSQANKDFRVPNWKGLEGTVAKIVYQDLIKRGMKDPSDILISYDLRNKSIKAEYKHKIFTKKFKENGPVSDMSEFLYNVYGRK